MLAYMNSPVRHVAVCTKLFSKLSIHTPRRRNHSCHHLGNIYRKAQRMRMELQQPFFLLLAQLVRAQTQFLPHLIHTVPGYAGTVPETTFSSRLGHRW